MFAGTEKWKGKWRILRYHRGSNWRKQFSSVGLGRQRKEVEIGPQSRIWRRGSVFREGPSSLRREQCSAGAGTLEGQMRAPPHRRLRSLKTRVPAKCCQYFWKDRMRLGLWVWGTNRKPASTARVKNYRWSHADRRNRKQTWRVSPFSLHTSLYPLVRLNREPAGNKRIGFLRVTAFASQSKVEKAGCEAPK